MKFTVIPCVGLILSLSGCLLAMPLAGLGGAAGMTRSAAVADADGNMARATALALGRNIDPHSIKISDPHVGSHETRWVADTPSGRYDCSDDGHVTGPAYCMKH